MTPPFLARALVTAITAPLDYESIAGDLHEEYEQRVRSFGRASADEWYWSQALRSIPSLLSYSRSRSFLATALSAAAVIVVLLLMLTLNELIDDAIHVVYRNVTGFGTWPFFVAGWTDAAIFGAILAAVVRSHGMRLTIIASLTLLGAIAIPIYLRFSSPLTLPTWILLFGAVPSMIAGAAAYQIIRRT